MKKYEVIGRNVNGHFNEYYDESDLNAAIYDAKNLFNDSGYMYELDKNEERVHSIDITATVENEPYDVSESDLIYIY